MVRVQGKAGFSFFDDRCLEDYLKDIDDSKPLSRREEKAIFDRIKAGDRRAFNKLIRANLRFVVSVSLNYRNQGVPLADLINEGNLGLVRAVERFNPSLEYRFISYAVWWVRQAILAALAAQGRPLSLSTNRVALISKVEKAATSLLQSLGRDPTEEEISEAVGLPRSDVRIARGLALKPAFLERPESADNLEISEDSDLNHGLPPIADARRHVLGKILDSMMDDLGERERDIVRRFHGLGFETGESMKAIAGRYGLSRQQVAEILKRANRFLRESPEAAKLRLIANALET